MLGSKKGYPIISVVLTTYNSELTVKQVLESILKQSYPLDRIELIIIDGGSKDLTLDIIREFIKHYRDRFSDVRLVTHDKNYGVSRARNDGIKLSRGDYILILDHDVILNESTLETLYEYLKTSPSKVAGVVPLHVSVAATHLKKWEELLFRGRVTKTLGATSCLLVRREVIDQVGLYDETLGPPYTVYEDIEYGARIVAKGFEIHLLGTYEVLHDTREFKGTSVSLYYKKLDTNNLKTLKILASLRDSRYKYANRINKNEVIIYRR